MKRTQKKLKVTLTTLQTVANVSGGTGNRTIPYGWERGKEKKPEETIAPCRQTELNCDWSLRGC